MNQNGHHTIRKMTAESRTDELRRIREVVEQEAVRFGFDAETAFRLALAVDEACANVIRHAYRNAPGHQFSIEIGSEGDRFVVSVTDSGVGFTPTEVPSPDLARLVERRRGGGLGLHIIHLVMDDIDYAVRSGANRLRLVKYLRRGSE